MATQGSQQDTKGNGDAAFADLLSGRQGTCWDSSTMRMSFLGGVTGITGRDWWPLRLSPHFSIFFLTFSSQTPMRRSGMSVMRLYFMTSGRKANSRSLSG